MPEKTFRQTRICHFLTVMLHYNSRVARTAMTEKSKLWWLRSASPVRCERVRRDQPKIPPEPATESLFSAIGRETSQ